MLQFDVELCLIARNVAHKVRRYKTSVASGPVPDARGVYLRRWSELVSDVEGFILKRTHVVSTNKNQIRHRRISGFLTLSSLNGTKRGFL